MRKMSSLLIQSYKKEAQRDSKESAILVSIFEDAKENINSKMNELSQNNFVKYYILTSEKATLIKETQNSGNVSNKKDELEKEVAIQEEQLSAMLLAMPDSVLDEKIAQTKAQKAEIQELLKNLDIEDKVTSFENQLKTLLDSICKMRKKKHSLEYKKHILQENLVEALRNIDPENSPKKLEEN